MRDSEVVAQVKQLHDHCCQVCGTGLKTPKGPYAEGAHIRPLGSPHDGPDLAENVLCLCPNHHVLFDAGAFSVADDFRLLGEEGTLRTVPGHEIKQEYLQWHRRLFGFEREQVE
jgi:putative restriction endonuclease